jgi:hypothetical protein
MVAKRNAYRILVGKPDGKRPLGRPRRMWMDDIKMDHREIGWDSGDWIDMAQDRDRWIMSKNIIFEQFLPQNENTFYWEMTFWGI